MFHVQWPRLNWTVQVNNRRLYLFALFHGHPCKLARLVPHFALPHMVWPECSTTFRFFNSNEPHWTCSYVGHSSKVTKEKIWICQRYVSVLGNYYFKKKKKTMVGREIAGHVTHWRHDNDHRWTFPDDTSATSHTLRPFVVTSEKMHPSYAWKILYNSSSSNEWQQNSFGEF